MLSTGSTGVAHRELVYFFKERKGLLLVYSFFNRMKKIIFLTVAVLSFVALLPATASAAWTAPLLAPPGCTAGTPGCDAPVNVSAYSQTKIGQLILSVTSGYSSLLITNKSTGKSTFSLNPYTTDATTKKNFWTINGSSDGATWLPLVTGREGKVGIGTQINPQEVLDVAGAVKIGTTANANKGTIRWTGQDFEGYLGSSGWKSLTAGGEDDIDGACPPGQYVNRISDGIAFCSEPVANDEFDFTPMGTTVGIPSLTMGDPFTTVYVSPYPAVTPKKMVRAIVVSLSLAPIDARGVKAGGLNEIEIRGYENGAWSTINNYIWNSNGSSSYNPVTGNVNASTFIIPISPNREVSNTQFPGTFQIRNRLSPTGTTISGTGTIIAYIYGPNRLNSSSITVTVPVQVYSAGWGGHHFSCGTTWYGAQTEMKFVFNRDNGPVMGRVCSDAFVKALAGNGAVIPSASGPITIDRSSRDVNKVLTYTFSGLVNNVPASYPLTLQSGAMVNGLLSRIENSMELAKYSCNSVRYTINRSFAWSTGSTAEGTTIGSLAITCTR